MRVKDFSKNFGIAIGDVLSYYKKQGVVLKEDSLLEQSQVDALKQRFVGVDSSSGKELICKMPAGKKLESKDYLVGDLASELGCPASALIVQLLKQGVFANKNQVLKKDVVEDFLTSLDIEFVQPDEDVSGVVEKLFETKHASGDEQRLPVVAVIGHVDHGKTTLLDFLRRTKVAEKEAGGITQQIGAYEVATGHGDLVVIDTPGHEAFALMRERGVVLADIVVLVVALDDGVKPQTIECIKVIESTGATVVVALNKVDKAQPTAIEDVKRQVSEYGLLPDEWGGQVPFVAVSAKSGQGVDELLEVVRLQADMMDLRTSSSEVAHGFVLESKMERGRGATATLVLQRGTVRVGNHFVCGDTSGRVSSMVNSFGKSVATVGPSSPVVIAGFSSLPSAGDFFKVVKINELKKYKVETQKNQFSSWLFTPKGGQYRTEVNVILRASSYLSREALLDSLKKIIHRSEGVALRVVDIGVGNIGEGILELAATTKAVVYGLGVKLHKGAIPSQYRVAVKTFDIIYKLLEDVEELVKSKKDPELELIITGKARVKAIFKVKSIGTIAGADVVEGVLRAGNDVRVYRDDELIGQGSIKTLQKERSTISSVAQGSECAFSVDGFSGWELGDEVRQVEKKTS